MHERTTEENMDATHPQSENTNMDATKRLRLQKSTRHDGNLYAHSDSLGRKDQLDPTARIGTVTYATTGRSVLHNHIAEARK